ncbi:hypothetical protein A5782_19515 [Mycobacterium sp. 852002-40037_SCH5390672]|nr:hypothetical protein A5782_19515 [Mycobacterium sp. 852002-40037_SCH5390672]
MDSGAGNIATPASPGDVAVRLSIAGAAREHALVEDDAARMVDIFGCPPEGRLTGMPTCSRLRWPDNEPLELGRILDAEGNWVGAPSP